VYDPAGTVLTHYPDHTRTGGEVVEEDALHAEALGLSPLEHRLLHELAHHVVALERGVTDGEHGCWILWRSAHGLPQREEAGTDEWYVTAVSYAAYAAQLPSAGHYGALMDLQALGIHVPTLCRRLRWLMDAARLGVPEVVVMAQAPRALRMAA